MRSDYGLLGLVGGVLITSVFSTARVEAAESRVIAVFDIRDLSERLDAKALENLTTYFTSQLDRSAGLRTVSRSDIRDAIRRLKSESYKECYDERCQIEVGKEVAAEYSVLTQIVAIGSKCAVTATMYNLRTATSERTASEKSACDVDALVGALERAARVLAGAGAASTAPTAAASPPPPAASPPAASPPPAAPPPPPMEEAPTSAAMVQPRGLPVLPLAVIGAGVAVAAVGPVFLVLAKGHEDDANNPTLVGAQFEAESAASKQTTGLIFLGAGAAVIATGAVLWALDDGDDDTVAFAPTISPDGAFAHVIWRN